MVEMVAVAGAGGDGCLSLEQVEMASRMENALDGARTEESSHSRSRCRWVSEVGAGWSMGWEEEIAIPLALIENLYLVGVYMVFFIFLFLLLFIGLYLVGA